MAGLSSIQGRRLAFRWVLRLERVKTEVQVYGNFIWFKESAGATIKLAQLLKILVAQPDTNFWIECADLLGVNTPLQMALGGIANEEDIRFVDAATISLEKARQLERDARLAPAGSSKMAHYFVFGAQRLPGSSIATLLKVVEEAKYARFIFQAQSINPKTRVLASRCSIVRIPFFQKKTVLANLQAMKLDQAEVAKSGLYDGTITGSIRALAMKDTLGLIRKEARAGTRGITSLYSEEIIQSPALDVFLNEYIGQRERVFMNGGNTLDRKKLVIFSVLGRKP